MSRWCPDYSWVWVVLMSRWNLKLWSGGFPNTGASKRPWGHQPDAWVSGRNFAKVPLDTPIYNSKRAVKRSWKGPDTWYRRGVGFWWSIGFLSSLNWSTLSCCCCLLFFLGVMPLHAESPWRFLFSTVKFWLFSGHLSSTVTGQAGRPAVPTRNCIRRAVSPYQTQLRGGPAWLLYHHDCWSTCTVLWSHLLE